MSVRPASLNGDYGDLERGSRTGYGSTSPSTTSGSVQQIVADNFSEVVPLTGYPKSLKSRCSDCYNHPNFMRIMCAAFMGIALVVLLVTAGYSIWPSHKHHHQHRPNCTSLNPPPHYADEICEQMATVAAPYLEWQNTTMIPATKEAIVNIWNQFCAGPPVVNPATISWGETTLISLENNAINMTVKVITGQYYYTGQNTGDPYVLYELLRSSFVDYKGSQRWFGLESFWIADWMRPNVTQMRQGFFESLSIFCLRKQYLQPVFSNGGVTCKAVKAVGEIMRVITCVPNVWPGSQA